MLNKNFHHIVLLPLSAFVVSFLASLFIIPSPHSNNNITRNDIHIKDTPINDNPDDNEHSDTPVDDVDYENMCPICMGEFRDPCTTLLCGHKFCKECIDGWLKTQSICPCCRRRLSDITTNFN